MQPLIYRSLITALLILPLALGLSSAHGDSSAPAVKTAGSTQPEPTQDPKPQSHTGDQLEHELELWDRTLHELHATGRAFLRSQTQGNALDRAEAFRYVLSQMASSVTTTLAGMDDQLPLLRVGATNINKWGLDAADARYLSAAIDPKGHYIVSGTLGDAQVSAIQVVRDGPVFKAYDSLTDIDLTASLSKSIAEAKNDFRVLLSPTRPADWSGLWLTLPEDANRLIIREYFGDWTNENPGAWRLERIDVAESQAAFDTQQANRLSESASVLFERRLSMWLGWIAHNRTSNVNQIVQLTPSGQGLQENIYGEGWFRLENDEALVLELTPPQAKHWSIQLSNHWWESLDYIHALGSINRFQASTDPDGMIRIVIAHQDPGILNWLDTGGHTEGAIMVRYQRGAPSPMPRIIHTSQVELTRLIHPLAARANAELRAKNLEQRRRHVARRWQP